MNTRRLTASILTTLVIAVSADAADVQFMTDAPGPAQPVDIATRARAVHVQTDALQDVAPDDTIALDLFADLDLTGLVTRRVDTTESRFILSGPIVGHDFSDFMIAVHKDGLLAEIRLGADRFLRVRGMPGGWVAEDLDPEMLGLCGTTEAHIVPDVLRPDDDRDDAKAGGIAGGLDCGTGAVQDVLIVYSPLARQSAGGTNNLRAVIDGAIQRANDCYTNSLIPTSLNLVYMTEVDYNEAGEGHLNRLTNPNDGHLDTVHAMRDAFGADIVGLFVNNAGYCGIAWLMTNLSEFFDESAFNVTVWNCSSWVLAHEIGHNQGCCHDRDNCGAGLEPYSYGHRYNGNSGQLWRTTMSYSPGNHIDYFSTPLASFDGQPVGVAEGENGEADNALTIAQSAYIISNFRCNDGICEALDLGDVLGFDCDDDGVHDACEIALGDTDDNLNTIPDSCERPVNDTCNSGALIFDTTVAFDNEVAATETGPVDGCGELMHDVWYRYVASCTGQMDVSVHAAHLAAQVAVYDGCPDSGGQVLACDAAAAQGDTVELSIAVNPGLYYIRIGVETHTFAPGTLTVACTPSPCTADFDNNGAVDVSDLLALLAAWGTSDPTYDIAPEGGDGNVGIEDLLELLAAWGGC